MRKRLLQVVVLLAASLPLMGAATPSTRFDHLGHQLMCTCGCSEILLECNHVGCPDSPGLIAELHRQMAAGASDSSIFHFFATKYGATVLASPMRGGFDDVAWIMPFAVLFLGILAVVLLLRSWKLRHARAEAAGLSAPSFPSANADALRNRIRSETHYGS